MCQFFSCISDGKGKVYYFDAKIRKKIISGKLGYETDSHTSIADYYGFKGTKEDVMNKWEYNPLTGILTDDQINTTNDRELVLVFCKNLDFKKVVPELTVKPITHPFEIDSSKITKKHMALLIKWDSVRNSVGNSVGNSVWNSVRDSVRDSVGNSVVDSVWNSVVDSVGNSVVDSVGDSVWNSVRDSVWAYFSSFFAPKYWIINKKKTKTNPFMPCVQLWQVGIVPSFNGRVWGLHTKDGIAWKGTLDDAKNFI